MSIKMCKCAKLIRLSQSQCRFDIPIHTEVRGLSSTLEYRWRFDACLLKISKGEGEEERQIEKQCDILSCLLMIDYGNISAHAVRTTCLSTRGNPQVKLCHVAYPSLTRRHPIYTILSLISHQKGRMKI